MDPITHGLLAASIQKQWFKKKKYALNLILASALFPYIDHLMLIGGTDAFFFARRGLTHGLLFLFIVPMVLSLIASKFEGGKGPFKKHFESYYYISFLGYISHIFIDLFTPLGARVLFPIEDRFYSIGSVWNYDLLVTGVLALGLYLALKKKKRLKNAIIIALAVCAIYFSLRTAIMHSALTYGRITMDTMIVREVGAMPNSITQWWYIAWRGDRKKQTGVIDILGRNIYDSGTYPAEYKSAMVDAARRHDAVKSFLKIYPEINIKPDWKNKVVRFESLRYTSPENKIAIIVNLDKRNIVKSWKVEY
jgi:membrane-bound metal-dependent hydrolase YbcI (DUF457 family)